MERGEGRGGCIGRAVLCGGLHEAMEMHIPAALLNGARIPDHTHVCPAGHLAPASPRTS